MVHAHPAKALRLACELLLSRKGAVQRSLLSRQRLREGVAAALQRDRMSAPRQARQSQVCSKALVGAEKGTTLPACTACRSYLQCFQSLRPLFHLLSGSSQFAVDRSFLRRPAGFSMALLR